MSPQDWLIVAAAVLDLIFVIVLVIVGLRFKALAGEGTRMARPLSERGRRIAGTGQHLVETARTRGETMLRVIRTVAQHVGARIETTRRIASEVVHPRTATIDQVARTTDEGRAWIARLTRLGAAARRAAGGDAGSRRRA
jgi:hypothetical protein